MPSKKEYPVSQQHWDGVYSRNKSDSVSWFQQQASMSLALMQRSKQLKTSRVIDVGAGASVLADSLLAAGVCDLTLVDLADSALATTKLRLGDRAQQVRWLTGDILQLPLPNAGYDVWHDRAVFHFMTSAAQRNAYLAQLQQALVPGGLLVIGTFASDGPEKCSGLPVCRYDEQTLTQQFANGFKALSIDYETHVTPSGNTQSFIWGCFKKTIQLTTPE